MVNILIICVVVGVMEPENVNFSGNLTITYVVAVTVSYSDEIAWLKRASGTSTCPGFSDYDPLSCYCDTLCFWYSDCCEEYSLHRCSSAADSVSLPDRSHLECIQPCIKTDCESAKYNMITRCSRKWKTNSLPEMEQNIVALLCEDSPPVDSSPATDNSTGIVYRNKYCGVCNYVAVVNLLEWPSKWDCNKSIEVYIKHGIPLTSQVFKSYCSPLSFYPPELQSGIPLARKCSSFWSLVNYCPKIPPTNLHTSVDYSTLVTNCSCFGVGTIVASQGSYYSNPYCSICNTAVAGHCLPARFDVTVTLDPASNDRITLTFFFDSLSQNTISYKGSSIAVTSKLTCPNLTVYDPYSESCRKSVYFNDTTHRNLSLCTSITLDRKEYASLDSITVQWFGDNLIHPIVGMSSENKPIICVNLTQDYNKTTFTTIDQTGPHSAALEALSYFGLALDIISGVSILFTYCIYRDLKTLYSKLLLNMVAMVVISDLVLVVGHPISAATDSQSFCTALAIVIHYVYLARFFSCSVLFSEATRTFYSALKVIPTPDDTFKRNCRYLSIYLLLAYVLSAAVTVICIIVNFTLEGSVGYGIQNSVCWMSNVIAISASFVAPLCLSLFYNIVSFVFCTFVVVKLTWFTKAKQENRNVLIQNFRVILALISVSGVSWLLFAFILIPGTDGKGQVWGRYIYVILNGSQLCLVTIAYICTKKMMKRYFQSARSKFSQLSHYSSNASTYQASQSTSTN